MEMLRSRRAGLDDRVDAGRVRRSAMRGACRRVLAAVCLVAGLAALHAGVSPGQAMAAGTIEVRNTASSGPDSLRDAINTSNRQAGKQTITFNIPGSGAQVITPLTDLPQITDAVKIDGYTQPGASEPTASAAGNPLIVIDGSNVSNGLDIEGSNSEIRGLVIHSVADGAGIFIGNGSGNVIAGNHLGVGANGVKAPAERRGRADPGRGRGQHRRRPGSRRSERHLRQHLRAGDDRQLSRERRRGQSHRHQRDRHGRRVVDLGSFDNFGVLLKSSGSTVNGQRDRQPGRRHSRCGVTTTSFRATVSAPTPTARRRSRTTSRSRSRAAIDNQIGGTGPDEGNVISGTRVLRDHDRPRRRRSEAGFDGGPAVGTVVEGNKIGTDATGTAAIPNDTLGVGSPPSRCHPARPRSAARRPARETSSPETLAHGIAIRYADTGETTVRGNLIGTDATGAQALKNGGSGIYIDHADDSLIGGTNAGDGNTIAHNGGDGVTVAAGLRNRILGNAIYDNDGLGIDLGADGQTPNDGAPDADMGANFLQNYPVIKSATASGASTDVTWTLHSLPSRDLPARVLRHDLRPLGLRRGPDLPRRRHRHDRQERLRRRHDHRHGARLRPGRHRDRDHARPAEHAPAGTPEVCTH